MTIICTEHASSVRRYTKIIMRTPHPVLIFHSRLHCRHQYFCRAPLCRFLLPAPPHRHLSEILGKGWPPLRKNTRSSKHALQGLPARTKNGDLTAVDKTTGISEKLAARKHAHTTHTPSHSNASYIRKKSASLYLFLSSRIQF